jgi:hypothetical protein
MAVYFTHCRVSRCCVVASDFVMYTLDRLCCLILIKKTVCIILMQRLGLPHFEKISGPVRAHTSKLSPWVAAIERLRAALHHSSKLCCHRDKSPRLIASPRTAASPRAVEEVGNALLAPSAVGRRHYHRLRGGRDLGSFWLGLGGSGVASREGNPGAMCSLPVSFSIDY